MFRFLSELNQNGLDDLSGNVINSSGMYEIQKYILSQGNGVVRSSRGGGVKHALLESAC